MTIVLTAAVKSALQAYAKSTGEAASTLVARWIWSDWSQDVQPLVLPRGKYARGGKNPEWHGHIAISAINRVRAQGGSSWLRAVLVEGLRREAGWTGDVVMLAAKRDPKEKMASRMIRLPKGTWESVQALAEQQDITTPSLIRQWLCEPWADQIERDVVSRGRWSKNLLVPAHLPLWEKDLDRVRQHGGNAWIRAVILAALGRDVPVLPATHPQTIEARQ